LKWQGQTDFFKVSCAEAQKGVLAREDTTKACAFHSFSRGQ
jgi:hypothetical protein